jgi:hypothetical protein
MTSIGLVMAVVLAFAVPADRGPHAPAATVAAAERVVAELAGDPVGPDTAPPAGVTACAWTARGRSSKCDGLDPNRELAGGGWPGACATTNELMTHDVATADLGDGVSLTLTYSAGEAGGCRTVAAAVYVPHYRGTGRCEVAVVRTSDGSAYTQPIVFAYGFWSAQTSSLYDAGVTSYARATCRYGGHTHAGRTTAF